MSMFTDLCWFKKIGGMYLGYTYGRVLLILYSHILAYVFLIFPSNPSFLSTPFLLPTNCRSLGLLTSNVYHCVHVLFTNYGAKSSKVQSLNFCGIVGNFVKILSLSVGILLIATFLIRILKTKQIIGVNIWQMLVQG